MTQEFRAKVFKSGNSNALRLPKSLGFTEGDEVVLVPHADGSFSFYKAESARDMFMSLYGSMSPGFMAGGRDDSEQEERDWSRSSAAEAA